MPLAYRNAKLRDVPVNPTLVDRVVPAQTIWIVQSVHIANKTALDQTVTLWWRDASDNADTLIGQVVVIPAGGAANPLDRPLVLEAGDSIRAQAGSANALDLTLSIAEYT